MGPVILTVTPNPAYDVTYRVDTLARGQVHRPVAVHRRVGGKGVNVASVLHQLGEDVVATGFASRGFAEDVAALGIGTAFVESLDQVRTTLAVVDGGATTSFWEHGAAPVDGAAEALCEQVKGLLVDAQCLVVSGSLPPGVAADLPARLGGLAAACGVPFLLDTSGPALRSAIDVEGAILMPNEDELAELTGWNWSGDLAMQDRAAGEVAQASRALLDRGPAAILATRGAAGMVLTTADGSWHVATSRMLRGNPTGAGDAAAAAVARALAAGHGLLDAARDAVAVAAAAVVVPTAGTIDLDCYADIRAGVVSQPIS